MLLFLTVFSLAVQPVQPITCNNCVGKDCETGSCEGSYCVDHYTSNSDFGTITYSRGCYTPVAGSASKPKIDANLTIDFSCDVSVLGALTTSVCVCNTDKCNSGPINIGAHDTGPITCAMGTAGADNDTCNGTTCRYGEKDLGVGCEYADGFFFNAEYQPAWDFNGCFKIVGGTSDQLQCHCNRDLCNKGPSSTKFDRPHKVTCKQTQRYHDKQETCNGDACYINGVNTTNVNGFDRGCIEATGSSNIMPYCMETQMSGVESKVQVCLCVESSCNVDIDRAIESMKPKPKAATRSLSSLALLGLAAGLAVLRE